MTKDQNTAGITKWTRGNKFDVISSQLLYHSFILEHVKK